MSPPSSIEESGNLALDKETTEHPEPPGKKDPAHHHGRLGIQHRRDTPDPANDGVTSQPKSTRLKDIKARLVDAAKFLPLGAAVIAPLATLLDIPALTQPWFTVNGVDTVDPGSNLAVSAVTLALGVLANGLLVARFTASDHIWRRVTVASCIAWIVKLIFALVNLGVYGSFPPNQSGYAYDEGFFCAVAASIITGLIVLAHVIQYALRFDRPTSSGALIRVAGAEFMLTVLAFVGLLALEALVFSKIEGWSFFDGVYFSLVTAFTIGFGDFKPTYNLSRVLLFPFAVMSIAFLAVLIGVLVDFLKTGAKNRRSRWRQRYETKLKTETERRTGKHRALVEEIAELQKMESREKKWERNFALATSSASLVVFWLIGGAVFMAIEGMTFGSAMYFTYVFFLTIGYGDYAPKTPGGRVFFVIYALMAVPVVTNFVLSTVASLLQSMTATQFERARDTRAPTTAEQRKFHTHAYNVENSTNRLKKHFGSSSKSTEEIESIAKVVLGLAIRLEAQASTLLIEALEDGSKPQLLLRGDRNLMMRALKELQDEKSDTRTNHGYIKDGTLALGQDMMDELEEAEDVAKTFLDPTTGETDILEEIRRYRETLGGLLAAGTLLMGLDGAQRQRFERRLDGEHEEDYGGMLLGYGRKGPAEEALGVDV